MTATTTTFASALKQIWADGIEDSLYENNPAWALCPKTENWTGKLYSCEIDVGGMNGISSTFTVAKANKSGSQPLGFDIPPVDRYAVWGIEHKLTAIAKDEGAVVEALGWETSKAMKRLGTTFGQIIHGNNGGAIGQRNGALPAADTIELFDAGDIKNFEPGDKIFLSAGDGTLVGDVLKAGAALTVKSVDITAAGAGRIQFTAGVVATVATAAASDFLFREGDFKLHPAGMGAFNPYVAPAATAFFGMDRTIYPIRQAGVRIDVTAVATMVDKVKAALARGAAYGATYTHGFLSPDDWNTLDSNLQSAKRYVDEISKPMNAGGATVGFTGIQFYTHGAAPLSIMCDPYAKKSTFRAVNYRGSFGYKSAGKAVRFLTLDGSKDLMMEEATNTFEGRVGGYGNFWCKKPLDLLVAKLA